MLQLQLRSPLVSLTCCAIQPRNSRAGPLLYPKLRSMAHVQTPVSTSLSVRRGNQKSKGSVASSGQSKEDVMLERNIGIEDVRSDPARLDSLTLKELQTMTRNVGICLRGTKKELISALKSFCSKTENGNATSSAVVAEDSGTILSKKRAESFTSPEDIARDLSVGSQKKQKRSRRKQESVEAMVLEEDSVVVATQKKCYSNTEEVPDQKSSLTSKRVTAKTLVSKVVIGQTDSAEPWTILAHKKPQKDWIAYNPRAMRPPPLTRDTNFVKLMSWNVNGLRALLKFESFSALELAQKEDFDVLCLQETKIQEKDVEEIKQSLVDGYDHSFWTCSIAKLGYSGTAVISRIKPISVKYGLGISDHDSEGRLVTVEFDTFFLLCAYVPNSGDGLKRLTYRVEEWDQSLSNYMKELEKLKPVILTGDLNCAHQEIDIFNPAGNRRSAGFTIEERQSFEKNFLSRGFVDTFRKQHSGVVGYTYWGYRHGGRKTNQGWRLDYFLVSDSIADKVHDSYILPEVMGSDHCPVGLILRR